MYTLEEAKKIQSHYHTKAFYLMLEIAVAFLIPAILAVLVSKNFSIPGLSERKSGLIYLGLAFVLSWGYVVYRYRKVTREIRKIDAVVKELKSKEEKI